MTVFILCVVLAGAPEVPTRNGAPTEIAAANALAARPQPLFEIHKELRRQLRNEAVTGKQTGIDRTGIDRISEERTAWNLTVVELTKLYGRITRDPRLPSSEALEGYRVKLRSRLLKIQKRLERELASHKRTRSPGTDRLRVRKRGTEPQGATLAADRDEQPRSRSGDSVQSNVRAAGTASGSQRDMAQRDMTKGTQKGKPTGTAGGAAVDAGAALVELIQRTISPGFWDVNGGPGSIVYYRQWHALVIRATPEIHRRIGGPLYH